MSFPKKVSMPTASANPTGAPRRPGSAGRTRRRKKNQQRRHASNPSPTPAKNQHPRAAALAIVALMPSRPPPPAKEQKDAPAQRARAGSPHTKGERQPCRPPPPHHACPLDPGGDDHVAAPKPNPRTTTMSPPSAGSWQHCEHKGKLEARLPMNATNACSRGSAHAERTPRPKACWATAPSHG